ncbi:GNAT family N-acetyltransferase [Nocardioides marmoraquaticus]
MTRAPLLTDGVVTLRAHREDDVRRVLEQCEDPEMQRWTTVPVPYTLDDAKTFVRHLVPGGWESDRSWEFAVTARDGDEELFVGSMGLVDRGGGRAEIGYGTHPAARRRGLTERAARLLLAWGFAERDLQVVDWFAYRGNWASRRLAWRLGFDVVPGRCWSEQRGTQVASWYGSLVAGEEMSPRHPWFDVPVLRGDGVTLRPLAERDLPRIVETRSDPVLQHWLQGPRDTAPHTLESHADFLDSRHEPVAAGTGLAWTVADPVTDVYLGQVTLFGVQHRREAELAYWAHPDARGRGVTGSAVRLALRHCFVPWEDGGLGLRRLYADAADGNTASQRLLVAAGFREVGRKRADTLLGDGRWADSLLYDLLVDEWVS